MSQNSFTYKLTPDQQNILEQILSEGNFRPEIVPHTKIAVSNEDTRINLYNSGKCLVQGKGAKDWISFYLEPHVLGVAALGYEELLNPEATAPHMGIDESGKGDFFGPLVIASAFIDESIAADLKALDVKDSKRITSDKKAMFLAGEIRRVLKGRFNLVTVGPVAYNRLYAKMRNVNKLLAWGHARAIENLLEKVPDCPRALADQFGPTRQIEQALMKNGRSIKLEQKHKAESDLAVAAASILARAEFLRALETMGKTYETEIPKGASLKVREVAESIIKGHGPNILIETCKCHFKTADQVLEATGFSRNDLDDIGQVTSKPKA